MTISVCVGSSCHLKGSYDVIEGFKKAIEDSGTGDKITLQASFCLGHCAEGVTAKVDDEFITGLNGDNVGQIFKDVILPKVL